MDKEKAISLDSSLLMNRPSEESPDSQEDNPPRKKMVFEESLRIGKDIKVLRFQHTKLKQRLEQRRKEENDLIDRIGQLENRQTQDDAVINVINRYWNQLNEDLRILLQRYGPETVGDTKNVEAEATASFLAQLSTWDKTELDEKLASRVQISKQAVEKIIEAFDRLQQQNEKVSKAIKDDFPSIDEIIKEESVRVQEENQTLINFNTDLQEKLEGMGLKFISLTDKLNGEETTTDELQNQVDNLSWEVNKLLSYNDKLTNHIQDLSEKYRRLQQMYATEEEKSKDNVIELAITEISDTEVTNLRKEIEEVREQASNLLNELENLHKTQRKTLKQLEKLKIEIRQLPEAFIVETNAYKCLQSKFSVIYNDTLNLRITLNETRNQLLMLRTTHLKHIEHTESEELIRQKKLRTEIIHLEDKLGVVRKEYEILRLEFEQNLAAHAETGPINKEMRHLIASLQNHKAQLSGDVLRYKRQFREHCNENALIWKQREEIENQIRELEKPQSQMEKDDVSVSNTKEDTADDNKKESESSCELEMIKIECQEIRELRSQLQKAQNDHKQMKLELDMYKGASKDPRDNAEILSSVKKLREEMEEVKASLTSLQLCKTEEERTIDDEKNLKIIKSLEEVLYSLQRKISTQKIEEDILVGAMEVSGQAFEDLQEQNSRLMQQLREKDEANFKLLSDAAKAAQVRVLSIEERDLVQEYGTTLSKQVDAQNQVVRNLEEQEKLLLSLIAQKEQEAIQRQQAMEIHKRKAIESAQSAADLKLHLEKYHTQMKDAQGIVAEKTSALESEAYKTKRCQEDVALLKRKVERLTKIEMAGNTDEVMMEEVKEYKETLTCPSCKVKRKDAVLIKCFHVFCFDCLRTRYETRQRKCPKCNAPFGANDYHRLYLA